MLYDKFLIITLLLQTIFAFSACKKNSSEDVDVIAKELEKKFKYVKHFGNFTTYLNEDLNEEAILPSTRNRFIPEFWDWRDKNNVVGPIKDQKRCNACWAFSTVGSIESHLAIHQNKRIQLSEQFLIDCVRNGHDDAPKCSSFSILKAYGEIISSFGGVVALGDYKPYSGEAGECTYSHPPPTPVPVIGFTRVPPNEDAMAEALYNFGPLSAAINDESMVKYGSSDYIDQPTEEQCSSKKEKLNHAVVIVGYMVYVENGKRVPYWIIKNSWGEKWGDHGYYYLERGRNACGIANDVSYAIVPTL